MMTRKEQVSALACALFNKRTDIDECIAIANKYIQEAEARARAECAADTRRLDWLGDQDVVVGEFDADKWKEVFLARYQRSRIADLADIRVTIDAAMEGGK